MKKNYFICKNIMKSYKIISKKYLTRNVLIICSKHFKFSYKIFNKVLNLKILFNSALKILEESLNT